MRCTWLSRILFSTALFMGCGAPSDGGLDSDPETSDSELVPESEAVAAWVSENCEAARACGCAPSDMACTEFFGVAGHELLFAAADAQGLDYNAECMRTRLDAVAGLGCGGAFGADAVDLSALHRCKLFSGPKDLGETCVALEDPAAGDSCGTQTRCADGRCVDATPSGAGEACIAGFQACVDGWSCDDGICKETQPELPPFGDPCMPGALLDCGFESACGTDGVCGPLLGLGDACFAEWECGTGLECGPQGTCAEQVPVLCRAFEDT